MYLIAQLRQLLFIYKWLHLFFHAYNLIPRNTVLLFRYIILYLHVLFLNA